jgi:GNAT superfamily N-acetyltransferase
MLARAARRLEREGVTHVRLREAEISTLRFEPGSFAAVVISLGLHELPISIRNHILEQAAVWLKPGGRFVFCDYARSPNRLVAGFLRWVGRLVIEEEHFDEFMDYSIEEKLGRHGFTLVERRRRFLSCLEIGAWTARGAAAPAAASGPPAAQALPARAGDPPALRPLAAAELTGMSHVLAEAFMADPLYQALAPNPRARARWLRWVMALSLRASHQLGGALCLEDAPGAGAVCLIPSDQGKRSSLDYLRAVPGLPPLGSGVLRWIGRGLGMKHLLLKAHHRGPHVHLLAVGVAPNRQGRGAGGALLRGALRMAAERGLPCYLETASPRNVQLYQHLGFRVERVLTPRGLPPIWTMLCPPPES